MEYRRAVVPIMLIAALSMLAPMLAAGADAYADSIEGSDIYVTVPTLDISSEVYPGTIMIHSSFVMGNGEQKTIIAYIENKSSEYISVTPESAKVGDLELSTTISEVVIGPMGDPTYPHISVATIVLAVERYTDTKGGQIQADITLTDTSDGSTVVVSVVFDVEVDSEYNTDGSYNKFFGIIPNNLPVPFNNPFFTAALTFILWVFIAALAIYALVPFLTRLAGYRKTSEEKNDIRTGLTRTVTLLMVFVAIDECIKIVGAGVNIQRPLGMILTVLIVIIGAYIAWQIYMFVVTLFITGLDKAVDVEGVDKSLIPLFKMIGRIVIAVAAASIILASFGVDLGGILVSAGVISLGITLGAQNTLNQFFSGIVLLSTRPFQKNDFVKIGGEVYKVRRVRLMFTEFSNWAGDQIVTMPNNVVTSATLVNLTRENKATVIYVYMTVAYDANLTLAKELMIKAANMHPRVLKDHENKPSTRLTAFLDSGIEYRLKCTVDDFDDSAKFAGELREIIFKLFGDNGVQIPYNRLEVTLLPVDGRKRPGDDAE